MRIMINTTIATSTIIPIAIKKNNSDNNINGISNKNWELTTNPVTITSIKNNVDRNKMNYPALSPGKLGLAGAFCMGGPGVIMSRDVVLGVAPGLRDCLGVTVTGHEDTELGRCITINTGVQCSTNYEVCVPFIAIMNAINVATNYK